MAFLRDLGIRNWFSSYYSPALDGEQWRLFDGHRSHEGSSAYPKGFEKLPKYLADEFGCEEMRPQPGDTCDGPTESERLAMLPFTTCRAANPPVIATRIGGRPQRPCSQYRSIEH